ncbi:uncharacterized protein LOC115627237 [Scaptodrosophila lebanonensis]|uniref:Uncharacterized protein LOC115627237 n=1 Tax=Drosophila lebanonensis TaxID=7225 RepID=A0A6J2TT19_DROLE|nr:uncharacterized protein LOC115627237 [Scaptodrosophila lebanonensis]
MTDHLWEQFSNGEVPANAIVAGHDSDGDTIYVGRVSYNNDLLPAKIIPKKGKAYVAYACEEVELDSYEALTGFHYQWLPGSNGSVPLGAVKVGRNVDGEYLYAGRGYYAGSLTVGKVHPSHGCLYIPFGSEEVKIFQYEVLSQPESWLQANASSMPEGALVAGHDSDGDTIYVGRIERNGDFLPVKVVPAKQTAYVAYGSLEHEITDVEVLVGAGYKWVPASNGNVVPNAVSTGSNVDGERLYVGRANYCDSLSVGKIHPSHGCIYIPFGGEEVKLEEYEVLVHL